MDNGDIKKVEITSDSTEHSATFIFAEEDHTVGNTLRYMLNKDRRVDFCGYSVPHPLERKMNIRVQTNGDVSATNALMEAMDKVVELSNTVEAKYDEAMSRYEENGGAAMDY